LTHSQWLLINIVAGGKHTSVKDIADKLMTSSSAATQLIDVLIAKGWIKRLASAKDKRRSMISLSVSGIKKIGEFKKNYANKLENIFTALSDEELATFIILNKKIAINNNKK
jgi:DNA-binding MarR family transcriptional regulator